MRIEVSGLSQPAMSKCEQWLIQAADKRQDASLRTKAVRGLAAECREPATLQRFTWLVTDDADDPAVRKEVVKALPRWLENPDGPHLIMALGSLLRALSVSGIRPTAIQVLDSLGPVSGARETRLLAELSSLRSRYDSNHVAVIPKLFGRDPRVLDYLKELQRTGNRWQRALAASTLCGLGEMEPALDAARDPEPRVRKSLAAALGWFLEERGRAALDQLSHDPDVAVAAAARNALAALAGAPGPRTESPLPWKPLLKELSELRLSEPDVAAKLPKEKVAAGWLGRPGATEAQIGELEKRIGRRLPPSYRAFLATSNGFDGIGPYVPSFYGTAEVDWLRVLDPQAAVSRDPGQNLGASLQIAPKGRDGELLLLSAEHIEADGEWRTDFYASWVPGARPYPDFRAYVEQAITRHCEWRNY